MHWPIQTTHRGKARELHSTTTQRRTARTQQLQQRHKMARLIANQSRALSAPMRGQRCSQAVRERAHASAMRQELCAAMLWLGHSVR
jgi:hypothetical protein